MDRYSSGVMVALLPTTTDWCLIDLPHLTLVYAGKKEDLKPTAFNELAKDASMLSLLSKPLFLKVLGKDTFGDDEERVDALRLQPTPELLAMRRVLEPWNASEYPFDPHVTIGPMGSAVETPMYISFDRIMVAWGEENLVFLLPRT